MICNNEALSVMIMSDRELKIPVSLDQLSGNVAFIQGKKNCKYLIKASCWRKHKTYSHAKSWNNSCVT